MASVLGGKAREHALGIWCFELLAEIGTGQAIYLLLVSLELHSNLTAVRSDEMTLMFFGQRAGESNGRKNYFPKALPPPRPIRCLFFII